MLRRTKATSASLLVAALLFASVGLDACSDSSGDDGASSGGEGGVVLDEAGHPIDNDGGTGADGSHVGPEGSTPKAG